MNSEPDWAAAGPAVPAGVGAEMEQGACNPSRARQCGGRACRPAAPVQLSPEKLQALAASVPQGSHRALEPGPRRPIRRGQALRRAMPGAAIRCRPSPPPSTCSMPARCWAWPRRSRPTPRPGRGCASRSSSGWPLRRPATTWRSTPRRRRRPSRPRARASPRACRTCSTTSSRATCRMTDESVFEVGRNVATTEGAVVFENELFQLLEYKPLTAKVYERPFLLVPPCINKFYILDLQPENSLIRYAVEQGHRIFVVSWRNPDESMQGQDLGRLHRGRPPSRRSTSRRRSPAAKQINTLGFCVGGTILGTALAVLAARGEKPVASVTLLTTLARLHRHRRARHLHRRRLRAVPRDADGPAAACSRAGNWPPPSASCGPTTWSGTTWWATTSRAKRRRRSTCSTGTATPPTCRARCTPGTCATPTSRTTWSSPASCTVCGEKVDLGTVDMPVYIYGSREDHIVPIGGRLRVHAASARARSASSWARRATSPA